VDERDDVASEVLLDGGTVDVLLDLVSVDAEGLAKFTSAVRPGGRVASTAGGASEETLKVTGLTGRDILAMPNRETLRKLLALLELGMFRISVEEVLPLEQASARLDALANRVAKG